MFDQRLLVFPDVHRDPLPAPAGPTSRSISIVVRRGAGGTEKAPTTTAGQRSAVIRIGAGRILPAGTAQHVMPY
jgi:hypothetical protein